MRSIQATGRVPFVAVLGVLMMSSASARGQAPSPGVGKVAAEALFEEGRKLVAEHKYGDACPKFAESERLDSSPSTLLNLANCWERLGRTATAWATYKEAESAASAAHRQDYTDTAGRHARSLAPTLSRLTIAVQLPVEGMQVKRDGVVVGPAEWGSAIPIDAGSHTVEASAPGYKPWAARVDVQRDGVQSSVTVPFLEARPAEAPAGPPPMTNPPLQQTSVPAAPPFESTSKGTAQRAASLIVGGAGVVGLGVSGVLAILAKSKYSASLSNCETDNHNLCLQQGLRDRDDARSLGDAATVAFVVGAAAIVGGGVLWFTAPRGATGATATRALRIVPTVGGVVATGAW